jgi:hypothetical protein
MGSISHVFQDAPASSSIMTLCMQCFVAVGIAVSSSYDPESRRAIITGLLREICVCAVVRR